MTWPRPAAVLVALALSTCAPTQLGTSTLTGHVRGNPPLLRWTPQPNHRRHPWAPNFGVTGTLTVPF